MPQARRIAVIGAGWAGLAAAVEATRRGHQVTLFEMAKHCGGRARSVDIDGLLLDNGQHIMIGAYSESLRLMRLVAANPDELLLRTPLTLRDAAGKGLTLRPGPALLALALAVARHPTWTAGSKLMLAVEAARWALARFQCAETLNVAALTARLPADIRRELIDPLCIAALNTPSDQASASVFLRVLRDALFAAPGSSDLLLPRVGLSEAFPAPALRWLRDQGAAVFTSTRIDALHPVGASWSMQGQRFDRVVLATTSSEAARLAEPHTPHWAAIARRLPFEPIMTVYLRCEGARLPFPMLALDADADRPAQFVFDRGQLGGPSGLLAFVISGASNWVERGTAAAIQACMAQAAEILPRGPVPNLQPVQVLTEKRATFRCVARLERPPTHVASHLVAAGDYVAGPYPATLEGSVRSGVAAVHELG
ncbi:MAG: hydroxysqualene dehydroxylase HpnE [Burkholderiaceae bacterium]